MTNSVFYANKWRKTSFTAVMMGLAAFPEAARGRNTDSAKVTVTVLPGNNRICLRWTLLIRSNSYWRFFHGKIALFDIFSVNLHPFGKTDRPAVAGGNKANM